MNLFLNKQLHNKITSIFIITLALNSVVCPQVVFAKSILVSGEFTYKYGDDETLNHAKERCKNLALKNAVESAMVYIKSETNIDADGLRDLDISTLAVACLRDVKILEEIIEGRNIYYKIQATANVSKLENNLKDFLSSRKIRPDKPIKIAFYGAVIKKDASYGNDEIDGAPDSYILVKNKEGNEIFFSGHYYLRKNEYTALIKNRNNFNPHFGGISFNYTFTSMDDCLYVQLMDWDGLEGLFGINKTPDDAIGAPYKITANHGIGKTLIDGNGWKMEIEILECR